MIKQTQAANPKLAASAAGVEPPSSYWRDPASFDAVLVEEVLAPLHAAAHSPGGVPAALQQAMLRRLHWYFTVDNRERAPTVSVSPEQARVFHGLMAQIMAHIAPAAIAALVPHEIGVEEGYALLSYRGEPFFSSAIIDRIDRGMARVTYFVRGLHPIEAYMVHGVEVVPAYAKYRACKFFHEELFEQRIVWLPAASEVGLAVVLNGAPVAVGLAREATQFGPASASPSGLRALGEVGRELTRRGALSWADAKAALLWAVSGLPVVCSRFKGAWVFIDREEDADDNAEHLYRWVSEHHPEVNAWFLMRPNTADWHRLAAEGFRLMAPGAQRRLLLFNAAVIVSSHSEMENGGFDPAVYGRYRDSRFVFVPHGISKDDVSHWLGRRTFDLFAASCPAEYASMVDDGTPYPFTGREIKSTGFPRRDKLLELVEQLPPAGIDTLLIMPTWRANFVDGRSAARDDVERMAAFAASPFCQTWRELLGDPQLQMLAQQHNKKLAFMAHPNLVPFLAAFSIPPYIDVLTKENTKFMPLLSRCVGLITDYTSVAFELGYLRRQVFYFQFDREAFYGGDHNWRPGYFDYDRDGFGPISFDKDTLMEQIAAFFANDCQPQPEYLARMVAAMPDEGRDKGICARVYNEIVALL